MSGKSCTTSLLLNCAQNTSKLLTQFGMHPKTQGGARLLVQLCCSGTDVEYQCNDHTSGTLWREFRNSY